MTISKGNKKLLEIGQDEIRKLLNRYSNIIEKLKDSRIIKTAKVVGDYGEYIASKKLCLDALS